MLKNINKYIKYVKSPHDDDGIDRLNYVWTIYVLLGFAATLFVKNYVGEPIQCWVPNQWRDNWESFSESYCFVENTYFVPMNSSLPDRSVRSEKEMIYYQWVPFALSAMALFFYLPRAIWKAFSINSGLTLGELMSAARKVTKGAAKGGDDVAKTSDKFASLLHDERLFAQSDHRSYLANLYLVMKGLLCVNVVVQLILVNVWLGTDYKLWGWGILSDMLSGRQWHESGHFPRVAFCDVTVREMGNINDWTLQCVLMVNMFNEKIFIFLWFWFVLVAVLTIVNFIQWVVRLLNDNAHFHFLEALLDKEKTSMEGRELFYRRVLNRDGILILRLVDENCGRIVASDVACKMWRGHHNDVPSPI